MNGVRNLRSQIKPGEFLCSHCTALCCRYFSLPLDAPKTWDDYDVFRWYLAHGRVSLFVERGQWYIVVFGDCQYLRPDHLCGIYENRPTICRAYHTDDCEFDNDFVFEKYFEAPSQIDEYAEAILGPRHVDQAEHHEWQLPVIHSV